MGDYNALFLTVPLTPTYPTLPTLPAPHSGSVSTVDDWKLTPNVSRLQHNKPPSSQRSSPKATTPSRHGTANPTNPTPTRWSPSREQGYSNSQQHAYPYQSTRPNQQSPKRSVNLDAGAIDVFYPEDLPGQPYYEEFDDEGSVNSTTTRVGWQ
jgi:hypothetical protein